MKSGMVLQDLVNELGRRLDYGVTNGRYQGTTISIGLTEFGCPLRGTRSLLKLRRQMHIASHSTRYLFYRDKLITTNQLSQTSSILIVVGRQDTGELEAQVRGSRHAWDIRLISADALIRFVELKENSNAVETDRKIRSLLAPKEYTRLDAMIDVLFTTAKDVESASESEVESDEEVIGEVPSETKGVWQFTRLGGVAKQAG